jgi:hypothetical protein
LSNVRAGNDVKKNGEVIDMGNGEKKIKCLNIRMDETLYEEFEAFCKDHKVNMEEEAGLAIKRYLGNKAHWIEHPHEQGENWEYSMYECSACQQWQNDDSDFCPNCGAEMEEE